MDKTAQEWFNEATASMERAARVIENSTYGRCNAAENELALAQAQLLAAATAQLVQLTELVRDGLTEVATEVAKIADQG